MFTPSMFQQMPDGHVATSEEAAQRAVENLSEMAVDLRGVAVFDSDRRLLASSADAEWTARAKEIWSVADGEEIPTPNQIHIATDAGEVFAVRSRSGTSAVAVSARFALESLTFCDLRSLLRELDAELAPL